jgi:hypothetical protein
MMCERACAVWAEHPTAAHAGLGNGPVIEGLVILFPNVAKSYCGQLMCIMNRDLSPPNIVTLQLFLLIFLNT